MLRMSMVFGAGGAYSNGTQGSQSGVSLSSSPPLLLGAKQARPKDLRRNSSEYDSMGKRIAAAAGSCMTTLPQSNLGLGNSAASSSSSSSSSSNYLVSAPIPIKGRHRAEQLNALSPPVIKTGTPPEFSPVALSSAAVSIGRIRSPAHMRGNSVDRIQRVGQQLKAGNGFVHSERTHWPDTLREYQRPPSNLPSAAASVISSRRSSLSYHQDSIRRSQFAQQIRSSEVEELFSVDREQTHFMAYIDLIFVKGSIFWHEYRAMLTEQSFLEEALKSYLIYKKYLEREKVTAKIFTLLRDDVDDNHLRHFTMMIPKVDLHSHLSGAMSVNFCLEKAIELNLFWDSKYKKFYSAKEIPDRLTDMQEPKPGEKLIEAKNLRNNPEMLAYVLKSLCMRGRDRNQKQDDYFFHYACPRNESVTGKVPLHEMLTADLKNAGVENVRVKEIMVDMPILDQDFPAGYAELFSSIHLEVPARSSSASSFSDSPSLSALASPAAVSASPSAAASTASSSLGTTPEPITPCESLTPPESMTPPDVKLLSDVKKYPDKWSRALALLQKDGGWLERYVTTWTERLKLCNEQVSRALKQEVENGVFKTMPDWFFLVEIMRDIQDEKLFFATIAAAMALEFRGRNDSNHFVNVVGLNLVGPEHAIPSMGSFPKQIEIIEFLSEVYKKTKISLHAGEFGDRSPADAYGRTFNMLASLKVASRIGHGTAIIDAGHVKKKMQTDDIPVEICLTSNEQILDINLARNPIKFYLDQHISVVLCTDNDGILETNLKKEFIKASKAYKWSYSIFKCLVRNALHYSFIGRDSQSIFIKNKVDGLLYLHPVFWGMYEPNWSPTGTALKMFEASYKVRLQVEMELKIAETELEMNETHNERLLQSQEAANQGGMTFRQYRNADKMGAH